MASIDPITGEIIAYHNSFWKIFIEMVLDFKENWLRLILPIVIMVGGFFLLRKFVKKKIFLVIYIVIAVLIYCALLFFWSLRYLRY